MPGLFCFTFIGTAPKPSAAFAAPAKCLACGLAPKTPLANVKALVEARNEYFNI